MLVSQIIHKKLQERAATCRPPARLEIRLGLEAFRKFTREMSVFSRKMTPLEGFRQDGSTFMGAKVRVHGTDMDIWVVEDAGGY